MSVPNSQISHTPGQTVLVKASDVHATEYIGDAFLIRNLSNQKIYCFVSKYSNKDGDDNWFPLTSDFSDGRWNRSGWELVAFKDSTDSNRGGFYLSTKGKTVNITVHSLQNFEISSSSA